MWKCIISFHMIFCPQAMESRDDLYPEPNTSFNYVNQFVFLCNEGFLFIVYSLWGGSFKPLFCLLKLHLVGFYQFDSFLLVYFFSKTSFQSITSVEWITEKSKQGYFERGWCVCFESCTEVRKGLFNSLDVHNFLLIKSTKQNNHHQQQWAIPPAKPSVQMFIILNMLLLQSNRKFDTISGRPWHPSSGDSYNSPKYFQLFLSFYIWPSVKRNLLFGPPSFFGGALLKAE